MRRISSAMNNMDTQSALRLQESRLNRANNQIGSQRKIQQLVAMAAKLGRAR